jgi:TolB-like protein/Flp pilus assembly protein TadD
MPSPSLLQRLKERKLVQWALAYLAGAWVFYEAFLAVGGVFGWPTWIFRVVFVLLGTGFLAALVVGWHHGERGKQRVSPIELGSLGGLVVMAVALSWWIGAREEFVGELSKTVEPAPNTIAVLPCENVGGDEANAAFVDGIHIDILSHLSSMGEITPISRTSVLEYRGTVGNVRRIAEDLGVATVMECSVQRGSGRVLVGARLVDAETDAQIWAKRFDQALTAENVFGIQAEVASSISTALATELSSEDLARIRRLPTENLDAYEYLVRAKQYVNERFEPEHAVPLLEQAINLDPDFAAAHAYLGFTYTSLHWIVNVTRSKRVGPEPPEANCDRAKQAIEAARELNPSFQGVHTAEAWYRYRCFLDFEGALRALEKAGEVSPNSVDILEPKGNILRRQGRFQEAIETFLRATELDPHYADLHVHLVGSYALVRQFSDAGRHFERSVSLQPDNPAYYQEGAYAYMRAGDLQAARDVLSRAVSANALNPGVVYLRAFVGLLDGRYAPALQLLDSDLADPESTETILLKADLTRLARGSEASRVHYEHARSLLEERTRDRPDDPSFRSQLGLALAWLGRKEEAIGESEAAVALMPLARDAWAGRDALEAQARVYAVVGEAERACGVLETLLAIESSLTTAFLEIDPIWDPLRSHPRFQALLEKG